MYPFTDSYMPHSKDYYSSYTSILSTILPKNHTEHNQLPLDVNREDIILIFTYYCGYVSSDEFLTYFHFPLSENKVVILRRLFSNLVKKGLLDKIYIGDVGGPADFMSHTFYHLTTSGYAHVLKRLQITNAHPYKKYGKTLKSFKDKNGNLKEKRYVIPASAMHDYSIGVNLFSLLSSVHVNGAADPFTREREKPLTHSYKGNIRSIQCDGYFEYLDHKFIIEQDLFNESNNVLIRKFENYAYHGICDHKTVLFLSCREPFCDSYRPCFDIPSIKTMYDDLMGMENTDPDNNLQDISNLDSPEYYHAGADLKELLRMYHPCTSSFRLSDLERYYFDLNNGHNCYRTSLYMRRQSERAREKLRQLYELYQYKKSTSHTEGTAMYIELTSGLPMYVVPTGLIGNYIDSLYLSNTQSFIGSNNLLKLLKESLIDSFPHLSDSCYEYGPKLPKVNVSEVSSLRYRNCFSSDYGNVYVEFISQDLGALIRVSQLTKVDSARTQCHIICIADQLEDALWFSQKCGIFITPGKNHSRMPLSICFLLREHIGTKNKLFLFSANDINSHYLF